MTGHDETLVLELLSNVARSGARNLNPGLGEKSAGREHESDVDGGVNGVEESLAEVQRRRHVVGDTGGSVELGRALTRLPDTEKTDEKVVGKARVEHLRDEEDVGREGGLQHDGHVGGVEETDGVRSAHATLARGLDGDLDTETLEVDDRGKDEESRQQVHDVRKVLAVECFVQGALLVGPGEKQVEECNDGTLELGATAGVDGRGRERLPDNGLADVGRNEERNTAAKTIALLEKLIEEDNDETSDDELNDEENADTSTEIAGLAVETSQDIDTGLAEGKEDGEELLRSLVELAVGLEVEVDVNQVGTGKELFRVNRCSIVHPKL